MVTTTYKAIEETWHELCGEVELRGLPYKVETDEYSRLIMSPTRNYHGFFASRINRLLEQLLPHGETGNELGIVTNKGVKVPDSVWVSKERFAIIFGEDAASIAPEICVEITSESNSDKVTLEKRDLYFKAGAKEVWFCGPNGNMRFFTPRGEREKSALCPGFPKKVGF